MAKFSFFDINCNHFVSDSGESINLDTVTLQFTKKVSNKTMLGEKGESFNVPISDIPYLFNSDVKIPAFSESNTEPRADAVRQFLAKYIGKNCTVKQIAKGKRNMLTYIEFE